MVGVEGRQAEFVRRLDERNRPRALGGGAFDLGHRRVDVPERHHHQRDLALGGVGAPLIDDEVVVGADAQLREVLVLGLVEGAAGESTEVREAQLGPHAFDIHVLDAVGDVMTPRQHVVVAAWVHAEFPGVLACDGVQGKVTGLTPFVKPGVVAVGKLHDARRDVLVLGGQPVKPDAGMFDDVIVDGDDSCIFGKHVISF